MADKTTPPDNLKPTVTVPPDSISSDQIGPYKILQELGEGGMGVVYLAEQREPIRRRVALKVIKLGMDTKQVVARFESERQALALMNHANVAKVFDAGATEQGRPYFVMEHVKGVPITEHCDLHRLTTKERLQLFMQVCEGVQHAHQKGIIHRDLKPFNVLVAIEGDKAVPKIIDFGVAKATEHRLTEQTVFTRLGQLIGTPEYMSPEQAEMTVQDIDTRTDVYSLGVILYELLVGALPFDLSELRQAGFDEIRRKIREDDPSKPSTRISTLGEGASRSARSRRTDPAGLRRLLKGDLDRITMKAVAKNRGRRFGSPAELAADIGRHLAHQPVLASPPSTLYRARKFVRRHRLGVAVIVAAALFLVAFAVRERIQSRQIAAERDRASRVLEYLKGVFEVSAPSEARGNEVTARELLDKSATRIEEELQDKPVVQAELMYTMGDVYLGLGLHPEAERLLEQALATRRRVLGDDHPDTLKSINKIGQVLQRRGKLEEAEPLFSEALERRRRVLGDDHRDTLVSIANMGYLLRARGELEEAELYFREALERLRRVLGDDHLDTLTSINNLGSLLVIRGKLEEAESLHREALERVRRVLGDDHPQTLTSINDMGYLLQSQGKLKEAEPYYREALDGYLRVLGHDHPHSLSSISNMGYLLRAQGKLEEAEPYYREALEGRRRVLGDDHSHTLTSINNMGYLFKAQGKLEEAEPYYREALEGRRRVLGDDHPHTLSSMNNMGGLLKTQGRLEEAESYYRQALDDRRRALGDDHPHTLTSINNMGDLLKAQGKLVEAEPYHREALEGFRRALGDDHPNTLKSINMMGQLLRAQGKLAEAEPYYREALEGRKRVLGDEHPETANVLYDLACLEAMRGNSAKAVNWLRQSVAAGWSDVDRMERDPDLVGLHDNPEFEAIIVEIKKRSGKE